MSWMERLYQTYEAAMQLDLDGEAALMPVSHTGQNAHIHVVIDDEGQFRRAEVLDTLLITLPATEKSASRSGTKPSPHPLSDKLQYVARDYKKYGGQKWFDFSGYTELLEKWCQSEYSHPKASAVLKYVSRGHVIQDLVASGVIVLGDDGKMLEQWLGEEDAPKIFKVLPKQKKLTDQGSALVAWSVEESNGNPISKCWEDTTLQQSWIDYEASQDSQEGLCYISGETQALAASHPKKLRHSGDGAKLISSNDSSGFTFRGRFTDDGPQAVGIAFVTTQKAHNALRWLIQRQGYRNGEQVYISWAVSCKPIPSPIETTWDLSADNLTYQEDEEQELEHHHIDNTTNLGAVFANQLNKVIAGYSARLEPTDDIVVMGIVSATPGRMSVIYYRELIARDYLERLSRWHNQFAWYQRHKQEQPSSSKAKPKSKTIWPISSPAPRLIAESAYGATLNDALKKSVLERIMPCIIDAAPFPKDLVDSAIRRVSNRVGYPSDESWRWEQDLGTACALYRGYHLRHPNPQYRKEYFMSLEENNHSRDYLYGRLLAIAERIEEIALNVSGEGRSTTAARLMQRFADRPYSTWRNLELALQPYMQRLQVSRTGFLANMKRELDNVLSFFVTDDFTSDRPLSGEFLLAYHCQRLQLRNRTESNDPNKESN